MEQHRRTLIKTTTWRFIAFLITWVVVYAYNQDIKDSTIISILANVTKTLAYYLHERVWNRVSFGRI